MAILIIFQIPWFNCPFTPQGRKYVSSEECHLFRMLDSQMDGGKSFKSSTYYFFISSLGIEKNHGQFEPSLKCFLIAILSILFTLQRHLWNSQYYLDNISEKLKNHHHRSMFSAVRFIQYYFEEKNWIYEHKKATRNIHLHRITHLDEEIGNIKKKINHNEFNENNSDQKNFKDSKNNFHSIIKINKYKSNNITENFIGTQKRKSVSANQILTPNSFFEKQ